MRAQAWFRYVAAAVAVMVAYFLLPWLFPGGANTIQFVLNNGLALSAAAAVVVGVRVNRPTHPLPWYLFSAGLAAFLAGDLVVFTYNDILGTEAPFPSFADVSYLGCYLLLAAGLLRLIRHRNPDRHAASLIDALVVSTGMGLLSWVLLIAPYANDPSLTLVQRLVATGFPVFAILLLAVIARLATGPGARTPAFFLILLGTLALLVADSAYGYLVLNGGYTTGGIIDAAWLVFYTAWGAAALHPSMRTMSDAAPRPELDLNARRLAVLTAAALIAPGVLAVQGLLRHPIDAAVISIASAVLFLLVVARMLGLLRHLRHQSTLLAQLARTDSLTGIANRRVWDETLPIELARAARDGAPRTVALLDLDHFKAFNDTYGHQAGDRLLTQAAAAWLAQARTGDLIARYGGEEFILLLPMSSSTEAVITVERLREVTPLGQTFSCGVASWDGAESAGDLVARADAALYRAKAGGRDRIEVDTRARGVTLAS